MKWRSLLFACAAAHGTAGGQQATIAPARVAIVGNDYAFIAPPASLSQGPTLFAFENRGKVRHELSIIRMKDGVTLKQLTDGEVAPTAKAVADDLVGVLVARPGQSAGGQLFVELRPGRYLIFCTLKDQPDAQPHLRMGMVNIIDVR